MAQGALSWFCDGQGVPQWESGGAGGLAPAGRAGTCWGWSGAAAEGDRRSVSPRTSAPRGAACRTGRSLSSVGTARTSCNVVKMMRNVIVMVMEVYKNLLSGNLTLHLPPCRPCTRHRFR